jgi:transposase
MIASSSSPSHTDSILWTLPVCQMDWERTPPTVQDYIDRLHQQIKQLEKQVETLQGRVEKTSQTSSKPPSSDSPFNKPKRQRRPSSGKRGGQKGHRGQGPKLLTPTEVHLIEPGPCACGHGELVSLEPYYTHQVIELPPIEMDIHHFILQQGACSHCGRTLKAQIPSAHQAGYGPRLTALVGHLAGMHRSSRRLIQDFCHSVLHIEMSLGAVQKMIDRVSSAMLPHYEAIAKLARQAPVGYIDETPWYCQNTLNWLWTLSTDTVSLYLIHPNRSKEAFATLIDDWQGILVSDGYGVYQDWVNHRQTCLAHLIRTARGLSEKTDRSLAACGKWALNELQTLCHMAKAPPTVGQWRAWYARFCRLIASYHDRQDDAGRLARRLQREMVSLWVFLREHGVESTNNRAERALRFAVLWRKCSCGVQSDKGNRWVERSLSLRQTCRQLGQSTFRVLVDAVASFFQGVQPDLSWLY